MPFVATLVAPSHQVDLFCDHLLREVTQVLGGGAAIRVIEPGIAADITFEERPDARAALEALLHPLHIDVIVQDAAARGKKLLVADMDSTLIGQECIDELAAVAGVGAYVAGITERAMRGEIAFEGALLERVALLKGVAESTIDDLLATRITLNAGARTLFRTMRTAGLPHRQHRPGGLGPSQARDRRAGRRQRTPRQPAEDRSGRADRRGDPAHSRR